MVDPEQGQAVTEIAEESPEAAGLVFQIVTASMDANNRTMDTLYEIERQRRQALEVHIGDVLDSFEHVCGGTVADYERVVEFLRCTPFAGREVMLAARHHENEES